MHEGSLELLSRRAARKDHRAPLAGAGSLAIVRLTWTGVVAKSVGPFTAGQKLVAHVAQFVETREVRASGATRCRIASIETFDCYEPFAPA